MDKNHAYTVQCKDFQEFENWNGEVDELQISFQREVEWRYASYVFESKEKINMDPKAFHKMFCTANWLSEDSIEVQAIPEKDGVPSALHVIGKNVRLNAPFEFSLTGNTDTDPYFTGGSPIKPELSLALPETIQDKILKACERGYWSSLEEIGLNAMVDRSMSGFLIWEEITTLPTNHND